MDIAEESHLLSFPILMSYSFSKFSSFLSPSPSWGNHELLQEKKSRRLTLSANIVCMSEVIPKHVAEHKAMVNGFGRKRFPPGFTFGAASSAYQIEGAWNEGGKGPSIWDTFTHECPEKISDGSNGDIAVDSYHRYKEDVKLLKDMNMDAYRFSISWSRILPKGSLKGGKNQEGINYYHKLIDELIKNGITPYITLFHWDVPQELENEYQGFLSRRIVNDFKDYCEVCFKEFGSKVKYWITLNEPSVFATLGYSSGIAAPGRCSKIHGCPAGDSMTEPYIVGHNQILAHAAAARLYKDKYQAEQGGEIGIALQSFWYIPFDEVFKDFEAVNRALEFSIAWYLDPLVSGDYPFIMRAIVRERLPTFTEEEKRMIIGSLDFIGINYYTARYVKGIQHQHDPPPFDLHYKECFAEELLIKNGVLIGAHNGDWLYVYPEGLNELLRYVKERYDNPPIYITENGYGDANANELTEEELRADEKRKEYIEKHLLQTHRALRMGANIKGFFVWSLTDNFEWGNGYTTRFGVNYVDYDNLIRYPKYSAKWLSDFLRKEEQPPHIKN